MLRLLNSFWWIGRSSGWGSFVYPVAQEQVSSKQENYKVSHNVWYVPPKGDERDDGSDEVEDGPDGSVTELHFPEEPELGVYDGVDTEHVGQEQPSGNEERRPQQKAQKTEPCENVDQAADEGQTNNGSLDHAIPRPHVAILVNVNGHFRAGQVYRPLVTIRYNSTKVD